MIIRILSQNIHNKHGKQDSQVAASVLTNLKDCETTHKNTHEEEEFCWSLSISNCASNLFVDIIGDEKLSFIYSSDQKWANTCLDVVVVQWHRSHDWVQKKGNVGAQFIMWHRQERQSST